MLTVSVAASRVEANLEGGRLSCPDCDGRLAPWGHARARRIRGEGRLVPRRSMCSACSATHVLLPVSCLLRRADSVTVIGAALLAKAEGVGHRRAAQRVGRPPGTVRGWCRRIERIAGRVRASLLAVAAQLGAELELAEPTGSSVGDVVGLLGALAAASVRRLGPCEPWRLAAAATGGRLLHPTGPPPPG
ncbi:MAG: helix-turn-helix domain-containing protein, partial [Pseudonocardiaceae bacterium]|nr:helix-turn-helix domain-containing protein [Pseudonocardiaceae bacterium]